MRFPLAFVPCWLTMLQRKRFEGSITALSAYSVVMVYLRLFWFTCSYFPRGECDKTARCPHEFDLAQKCMVHSHRFFTNTKEVDFRVIG